MGSPDDNRLRFQLRFTPARVVRRKKDGFVSEEIRKNFASDNVTPICPEVMAALIAANEGSVGSYGEDDLTRSLNERFGEVFDTEVAVFPIATGTAANSVALSALVSPYGSVLCDESAHINTDEGGAPEFYTHGAKLVCISSAEGRMDPATLTPALKSNAESGILSPVIQALSLTQANEWGTVYSTDTLAELSRIAHDHDLAVHLDGARLGNALAHLGCTPAAGTWKAGVDVLSFGGTKAGAMAAEAVVFFLNDRTRPLVKNFLRRIKRSGNLWSKHRFLSAQLLALLQNDVWLKNAAHANAMAQRLVDGLRRHAAAQMPYERQSNEVFVILPDLLLKDLEEAGYGFYRWPTPEGVSGTLIRLVTSYYTRPEDVDALLAEIAA
ncbi:low specificity L-threonine aldolase [Gluconobacter japonicus]|uniref:threonine aldolase family protein n=1 Tax=Gluconobacter japonicus TaxID=376620 RepID=UPI001B8BB85A|nr:beta-eliminating lyase-related protein [Gluconobacter japonicus]MBS1050034.1 aminotransferase class I/II-fold pyridoxal phosphate-dependent enzyme [Gluconobacter japonicus]